MGKVTGFLDYERKLPERRKIALRVLDWNEFENKLPEDALRKQGARCMDCGVPFCHSACPLGNEIPDWNDLVHEGRFQEALQRLHATNNFPEFTGWLCPAPCEEACVLAPRGEAVTIKLLEKQIVDRGFDEGWIVPRPAPQRSGKRVAIVGSGPAGLAAAQQLARVGHGVTVFERADAPGGLLRYGIPEFKIAKHRIDRRIAQLTAEGVEFRCGVDVGTGVSPHALRTEFDATLLCVGAGSPRDLPVPGRGLPGVHFAMEFLSAQNRESAGKAPTTITARDKRVIVLGGGDTGSDCVGTANRQRAASVTQLEILPRSPDLRDPRTPWPMWPNVFRVSSSHEEGAERLFSISTVAFEGETAVSGLRVCDVEAKDVNGRRALVPVAGSERSLGADLVLLAMGFVGVERGRAIADFGVEVAPNGALFSRGFSTNVRGIFAAGDARRGQSLVVWAIWEGREAAREVDAYLMGVSALSSSPQG